MFVVNTCATFRKDGQEKSRGKWDNPTQPIKLRVPGLPDVMPTGLTKDAIDAYLSTFVFFLNCILCDSLVTFLCVVRQKLDQISVKMNAGLMEPTRSPSPEPIYDQMVSAEHTRRGSGEDDI